MSPDNRVQAEIIIKQLEAWDAAKQLSAVEQTDPYNRPEDGWRPNAINFN
jgi:hypothetical protein